MIHVGKSGVYVLLFVLWASSTGAQAPSSQGVDLNGRWVSVDPPAGPWTFDLNVAGDKVTGRIMCDGGEAGPADITDGVITGSTITFKAKNPVAAKNITFRGQVVGNEILFERSVEIQLGGPIDRSQFAEALGWGVFGSSGGPMRFKAIRTGAVPKPEIPIRPSAQPINPTGRWESLNGNLDVWIVELKADGPVLTGAVSNTPGLGRQTMVATRTAAIYDGKIDGSTITFKIRSLDNARTLTFKGVMQGDEIAFTRTLEIPVGAAFGPDNIFSAYSRLTFLARRPAGAGPDTPAMAALKQAQARWQARSLKDYDFTVSFICLFCTLPRGPLSQRVSGTGANPLPVDVFINPNQPNALRELFYGRKGSIDDVFKIISAYAATRPFLLEAEYDPTYGYPIFVEIHPGGISTDDNLRIEITDFKTPTNVAREP